MDKPDRTAATYAKDFRERLRQRPDVQSHGEADRAYLYRPGQLLVPVADARRVQEQLRTLVDVEQDEPRDRRAQLRRRRLASTAGTAVLSWRQTDDGSTSVPRVLEQLRDPRRWDDGAVPELLPHHVVLGSGNVMGHPARPPAPAPELPVRAAGAAPAGRGVTIGVCDTGIWKLASERHGGWLGGAYDKQADDVDELLGPDGRTLDLQAGHGTFVAGVLRQAAPAARFDPEQALDPMGVGDLESVIAAIAGLGKGVSIVNLSLGCYTEDNLPPPPLARALAGLGRDVVVVAAAGNFGERRPTWPAAFKRVIAVAALRAGVGGPQPAAYSNWGPWVDASAVGVRTSTYVKGRTADATVFDGWAQWEGTSFAAPHVAGTIAAGVRPEDGTSAWPSARRLLAQEPWHPDYGVHVP